MNFVYCGFHLGEHEGEGKLYAFDPNPNLPDYPGLVKKAVWTHDGEVDFYIEDEIGTGSSVNRLVGGNEHLMVPCLDFSKFLETLDGETVCRMDIEGSEYEVLDKCLKDGSIKKINKLIIEFHDRFDNQYTELDTEAIIKRLEEAGVEVVREN